jgi:tyrosinase
VSAFRPRTVDIPVPAWILVADGHIISGMSAQTPLGLRRRQLVLLGAAAGLVAMGCSQDQIDELAEKIRNRPVRRDIATLPSNSPVLQTWRQGVAAMKALPSTDPRNWERQQNLHRDRAQHGNWLFLPWHRAFLYYHEEIVRGLTGDNGFALPYWNWTANPTIPAPFLDSGSPLFHSARTTSGSANPVFVGQPVIDQILAEPNFEVFTPRTGFGRLEGTPHNYVHGYVGGDMGLVSRSPRDPLFYAHHNRVDEVWVEWNLLREHPNTSDGQWSGAQFPEFFDRGRRTRRRHRWR